MGELVVARLGQELKVVEALTAANRALAAAKRAKDAPMLSGVVPKIRLRPGSYLSGYYGGKEAVEEEYFCNFEVNPEFEWAAMEAGFRAGCVQRKIGRDRDWRARFLGRLQCELEHEVGAAGELHRV